MKAWSRGRLAGLAVTAVGLAAISMGLGRMPVPGAGVASMPGWRIGLDSATAAELRLLPGLGPVLADRVVLWRDSGHELVNVDDLDAIKGIGPRTIEGLRPHLVGAAGSLPGEFTTTE